MLLLMLAAGNVACSGYYVTPKEEGALSVMVEATVVEIVYIDFSPRALARYTRNRDGSLTFHIEDGAASTLRCDARGATLDIPAGEVYLHNPEQVIRTPSQRIRLVRYTGDIFKYAVARRWAVGD